MKSEPPFSSKSKAHAQWVKNSDAHELLFSPGVKRYLFSSCSRTFVKSRVFRKPTFRPPFRHVQRSRSGLRWKSAFFQKEEFRSPFHLYVQRSCFRAVVKIQGSLTVLQHHRWKAGYSESWLYGHLFSTVQGSLGLWWKSTFFQKDDYLTYMVKDPASGLWVKKSFFSHSSRTLAERWLMESRLSVTSFATVKGSPLRTVVKKYLFQKNRLPVTFSSVCSRILMQDNIGETLAFGKTTFRPPFSPMFKNPASGLYRWKLYTFPRRDGAGWWSSATRNFRPLAPGTLRTGERHWYWYLHI